MSSVVDISAEISITAIVAGISALNMEYISAISCILIGISIRVIVLGTTTFFYLKRYFILD